MSIRAAPTATQGQPRIRVRASSARPAVPKLDAAQRQVVAHVGSPLLVLAGPGTGKTTTIVESVIARLSGPRPLAPEDVVVLTFGRVAAAELRSRIVARSAGGVSPLVATFHSFAWRLLREFPPAPGEPELQLLSGPDAELTVRELLADPAPVWAQHWPSERRDALQSPALADELLGLMAAARAQGWEPAMLTQAAAATEGLPGGALPAEWPAAAAFFEHYLEVLDWQGALDYSEVIHRARLLIADHPELRGRYRAIYIDEYQDTDPAQVALVRALVAPGTTVVAVGDPDQAIYRFRGADVGGILDFPQHFAGPDGQPAPVAVLRHTRRFGPAIRAVADSWIASVGMGGLPAAVQREHRSPVCGGDDGEVEVILSPSPEQQASTLADLLRRARLSSTTPLAWSDMAVLVRSGVADIPRLERALLSAGVPVEVPAGDRPLAAEPALAPLLTGLQLADDPRRVELGALEDFLCSPLVGMTALSLRRLLRELRSIERGVAAQDGDRAPRPAAQLLAACFAPGGEVPSAVSGHLAQELDEILATIDRMRVPGTPVDQQLWLLWSHGGTSGGEGRWAQALRHASLTGGTGAHRADAVLDCVIELFSVAERLPTGAGSSVFVQTLTHHRIPGARVDDSPLLRDSVALLTVHRAKGSEWPLVAVVGLQQGQWPDARGPATVLAPERIGGDGIRAPRTRAELSADERRLAFVAATRASQRLILMAVESDVSDEAPSVLFAEAAQAAGAAPEGVLMARPAASWGRDRLTPTSLVASLRAAMADSSSPAHLRRAAAVRLATLARSAPGGAVIAADADPVRWWGRRRVSDSNHRLIPPEGPLRLSATAVTGLNECALRWFLARRVHAGHTQVAPAAYGSLLHAAIASVVVGELPADQQSMAQAIRPAFEHLPYAAIWERERQWLKAQADIARFLTWFANAPGHALGAEVRFEVEVTGASPGATPSAPAAALPTPGTSGQPVRLVGAIDLVLADSEGKITVVDFKTGKVVPTAAATKENIQLGVYQLAVRREAAGLDLGELPAAPEDAGGRLAGGLLVFLAMGTGAGGSVPSQRGQPPLTEHAWLDGEINQAATTVLSERIVARVSAPICDRCEFASLCPAWTGADWSGT